MCAFEKVYGEYSVLEPMKAWKVFGKVDRNRAVFSVVRGACFRGKWLRHDDKEEMLVIGRGSLCKEHEPGFHCFVRREQAEKAAKQAGEVALPVLLKGKVTMARQYDEEILVGEWMYVPLVGEVERVGEVGQAVAA